MPRPSGAPSPASSSPRPPPCATWPPAPTSSALSTRNFDSSTFNAWFTAFTLDDPQKQAIAERRFRPEFKVAFDAWMATDPFRNPRAPPGPTYMPQYRLADQAKAEALDREAVAASAAGHHAGVVGDDYIRITVFLAAVLFLVGIGSTFKLHTIRYALHRGRLAAADPGHRADPATARTPRLTAMSRSSEPWASREAGRRRHLALPRRRQRAAGAGRRSDNRKGRILACRRVIVDGMVA